MFITGIFYQPLSSFVKWKGRGINTLVGYESEGNTVSYANWKAAAKAQGLRYIVQAEALAAADFTDPDLLAVILGPDEPDGAGNLSPGQMIDKYAALKPKVNGKPIMVNFDGWKMQWRPVIDYQLYADAADWLVCDFYPLNHDGTPASIPLIGARLDELKTVAPGKPVLTFVESSDQLLKLQSWVQGSPLQKQMRAPTPVEMSEEVAVAVKHGVSGIIYFADVIGTGWQSFDGTTPDLAAAMTVINAYLTT